MKTIEKAKKIKNNHFWRNLFKNSFWAFVGEASASLIGLVVTIILIKIIGSDNYGIIVLAQAYMSIMDVLINVQSWKSVIQYGQECIVKNNIAKLNSYIKLGAILDISTAIACMAIAFLLVDVIGGIFNWSQELSGCAKMFAITIVSHFAGTPTAILRLYNKFHLVALQKFLGALIKLLTLLVVYLTQGNVSLELATIAYCATDIINNLLLVVFAIIIYRKHSKIKNIIKAKIPTNKSGFISYTIWGTISEAADIPVNHLDVFIVSFLGPTYVSIFKVFKQSIGILQKVSSPIQQSIFPQFSELAAKDKKERGFEVVKKIHRTMMIIAMPAAIVIGLLSPLWLKLLYGELYAQEWIVLLVYFVVQVYALSYSTMHPYFLSLNQAKKSALYVIISNTVYIITAFLLIRFIGLYGMTIAFAVQCGMTVWLKTIDIKKILKKGKK